MKIEIVTGCAECGFFYDGDRESHCNINNNLYWYSDIPKEVPKGCPLRKQPICHVLKIEESK